MERLRQTWPLLAEFWQRSLIACGESIVAACVKRARDGVQRPIYQMGKLVGHEQVYSDRLAEVLLKGLFPKTFNPAPPATQVDARHQTVIQYIIDVPAPTKQVRAHRTSVSATKTRPNRQDREEQAKNGDSTRIDNP
jgi:hypothetical protein